MAGLPARLHLRRGGRPAGGGSRARGRGRAAGDAPARAAGRWLDYAVNLGASGIALGPVFASQTHGYDTTDHYRIDPRLGDEGDFASLAQAAHARGLRVLLDGVFNHVGRGFPAFQRVLEQGPDAPEASWFRLTWPADWQPGTEPEYATFEGHGALVALNHDEPAVAGDVAGVMNHWLDAGADGWRLDAAYAVPAAFWAAVVARVRAAHPGAYLVGEVIHGDYPAFVAESGLDSVTQYELWKAIWSGLNDHNLFELGHALGLHNGFLETFAPLTFVGNHDVTRLASRLEDDRHLAHALAVLLTVGGTPAIYYGDEQAFRGIKEERAGGDDEIRPGFPGGPDELAPACGRCTGCTRTSSGCAAGTRGCTGRRPRCCTWPASRWCTGWRRGSRAWWWRSAWRTARPARRSPGPGKSWPARARWPAPAGPARR